MPNRGEKQNRYNNHKNDFEEQRYEHREEENATTVKRKLKSTTLQNRGEKQKMLEQS